MLSMPDFFIIGAPKCGTSTLHNWLSRHPEIFAPRKEPDFFSQDIFPTHKLVGHIPTLEAYCAIFETPDPSIRLRGEATPIYLYSDKALTEIQRLNPDAKIIICVRNPVDLVISYHNQKVKEGLETEWTFRNAWYRSFSEGRLLETGPWHNGKINYPFWGLLGQRLTKAFEMFARRNIYVLSTQELRDTPRRIIKSLCSFLEVSDWQPNAFESKNVGQQIVMPRLNQAAKSLRRASGPLLEPILARRGGRGFGILRQLQSYTMAPGDYKLNIPQTLRDEMFDFFCEDTKRANDLLLKHGWPSLT